ncbi:MAG: hypothetical protein H6669_13090 [Ardenticatenaceae bacterium]|nr:hypothetical protein [Ardenticatenaceae bacterium]
MRTTYVVYMIGALALAGVVPLAGFWSKMKSCRMARPIITLFTSCWRLPRCSHAFYMGRQLRWFSLANARHEAAKHAVESVPLMTRPLIACTLATLGGLLNLPFFTEGMAANHHHPGGIFLGLEGWLEHSVRLLPYRKRVLSTCRTPIVLSPLVAGLSTVLALGSLALAFYVVYAKNRKRLMARPAAAHANLVVLDPAFRDVLQQICRGPVQTVCPLVRLQPRLVFWHDFVHNPPDSRYFVGFSTLPPTFSICKAWMVWSMALAKRPAAWPIRFDYRKQAMPVIMP